LLAKVLSTAGQVLANFQRKVILSLKLGKHRTEGSIYLVIRSIVTAGHRGNTLAAVRI